MGGISVGAPVGTCVATAGGVLISTTSDVRVGGACVGGGAVGAVGVAATGGSVGGG